MQWKLQCCCTWNVPSVWIGEYFSWIIVTGLPGAPKCEKFIYWREAQHLQRSVDGKSFDRRPTHCMGICLHWWRQYALWKIKVAEVCMNEFFLSDHVLLACSRLSLWPKDCCWMSWLFPWMTYWVSPRTILGWLWISGMGMTRLRRSPMGIGIRKIMHINEREVMKYCSW